MADNSSDTWRLPGDLQTRLDADASTTVLSTETLLGCSLVCSSLIVVTHALGGAFKLTPFSRLNVFWALQAATDVSICFLVLLISLLHYSLLGDDTWGVECIEIASNTPQLFIIIFSLLCLVALLKTVVEVMRCHSRDFQVVVNLSSGPGFACVLLFFTVPLFVVVCLPIWAGRTRDAGPSRGTLCFPVWASGSESFPFPVLLTGLAAGVIEMMCLVGRKHLRALLQAAMLLAITHILLLHLVSLSIESYLVPYMVRGSTLGTVFLMFLSIFVFLYTMSTYFFKSAAQKAIEFSNKLHANIEEKGTEELEEEGLIYILV